MMMATLTKMIMIINVMTINKKKSTPSWSGVTQSHLSADQESDRESQPWQTREAALHIKAATTRRRKD